MAFQQWAYNASWMYRNTISGLDPVMGNCKDCYFVAALGALAWTCPGQIRIPDASGNVQIRFWDTSRQAWSGTFTAARTEPLPMDESGSLWGSRSMDANETWPAIYEKFYAIFRGVPMVGDGPDIVNSMPDGNAQENLSALTSWRAAPALLTSNYTADSLWNALKPLTKGSKSAYPMVAWTYTSLPSIPEGRYAIIQRHQYPVLGIYTDSGGSNYLVLRNPLGSVTKNAGINLLDSGTWTFTEATFSSPGVQAAIPRPYTRTISFNLSQGLFALAMNEVLRYFEGIGYVT